MTMESKNLRAATLYERLVEVASAHRDAVALTFGITSWTFSEFVVEVDRVAKGLRHLGIKEGDAFAMYGRNCPEYFTAYLGAAKIGAVFVPINANVTESEVTYILQHSDAKFMFHDAFVAEVARSEALRPYSRPLVELTNACDAAFGDPDYSASTAPSDDLLIIYTSGSTGQPKAVVLTHEAQLGAADSMAELWSLSPQDATVVAAPMGFLLGLSTAGLVPMLAGMKVVVNARFHPGEVLDALVASEASLFHGVPTMYSMMLDYSEQQNREFDLSKVQTLICSGAPLPAEMVVRFEKRFGKAPQNYFGMTECYPIVGNYTNDSSALPLGAVGKLAPGAQVKFIDEAGRECGVGEVGEMYARAASLLKRYHKASELTSSALTDGWFRTGDSGYIDANGYVFITGRLKDLIIRGGANIAPLEIENVLTKLDAVESVAVIGVPDRLYGEVPVAYVVRQRNSNIGAEELAAFAKTHLADFKVPTHFLFRDALPLGNTGKVDKKALKKQWELDAAAVTS
jgi:long-chain acyl-CoA synthetase